MQNLPPNTRAVYDKLLARGFEYIQNTNTWLEKHEGEFTVRVTLVKFEANQKESYIVVARNADDITAVSDHDGVEGFDDHFDATVKRLKEELGTKKQ